MRNDFFSRILISTGTIDIVLKLLISFQSPVLYNGMALAFFDLSGNTSVVKDELKMCVKRADINVDVCYITLGDISSIPEDDDT